MSVTARRTLTLAGSAGILLAATLTAAPATADPWEVVADGLDNPRQLSFKGDSLYVAEAGAGGAGPCMAGPEGEEVCFGKSGAVTRVDEDGDQKRVLWRLPSLAARDGSAAIGPSDVLVRGGRKYALTIGLGADPAEREGLPRLGRKLMGTLVIGRLKERRPRDVVDIAGFEAETDLDELGPDSNPTGLVRDSGRYVLTDSGANTLLKVRDRGHDKDDEIEPLAVFDSPAVAPPPFGFPIQPVPTSVVEGPDGAYYVSELTGFPFVPGIARIHRVEKGDEPEQFGGGLTNVTDLAWDEDEEHLYAVQIADEGLLNGPVGSLVRVLPGGGSEQVVGGLFAPYGIAIEDDHAYLTVCSVCAGGGQVIRVELDD